MLNRRNKIPISVVIVAGISLLLPHLSAAAQDGKDINCPRPACYWAHQCNHEWGCQHRLPSSALALVAVEVNKRSVFFRWEEGVELVELASAIPTTSPADAKANAQREFAAFLATIAAGELGLRNVNDEPICLDVATEVCCDGLSSGTLGELIREIDSVLIVLDWRLPGDPAAQAAYNSIAESLRGINQGLDIEVSCNLDRGTTPIDGGSGYVQIGLGDFDSGCASSGSGEDPG